MKTSQIIYLPGLNGLRAIAALTVLCGHVFQSTFGNWGLLDLTLSFPIDGVTLFFVISGFLITFLLMNEVEKSGTVDIPKFYMRRILRIWPIYYGYLILSILILTAFSMQKDLLNPKLLYYLFFAANIPFVVTSGLWPIVHYWSIGVEEQFYLFWPWLVRIGKKRLLLLAVFTGLFWFCCKCLFYLTVGKDTFIYRFFAVTRFDCMMLGAVGAILFFEKKSLFIKLTTNRMITFSAWILFLLSGFYGYTVPAPIRTEYVAVLSLILIMSQVATKPFVFNLENHVCDFVGKISYGIYVIHPMLIFLLSKCYRELNLTLSITFQYVAICLLMIAITIIMAWLSYKYFEQPFLKFKNKFAVVYSRNSIRNN